MTRKGNKGKCDLRCDSYITVNKNAVISIGEEAISNESASLYKKRTV